MQQKYIITTTDPKMTILEKAKKAGFGMKLSCPDGLVSTEKGIQIVWYGAVNNDSEGEKNQFLLSLIKKRDNELEGGTPLKKFLDSLENVGLLNINKR
jgi:hypothetical protein